MIYYCHKCYMDGDWVEEIPGEDYVRAEAMSESECGFGDVVYMGY